jgi:hypothetical protein
MEKNIKELSKIQWSNSCTINHFLSFIGKKYPQLFKEYKEYQKQQEKELIKYIKEINRKTKK